MLTNKLTGAGAADKTCIEDVFSTYVYSDDGSAPFNSNSGIDLAGKGGMVWEKRRDAAQDHTIVDTARGGDKGLVPNLTQVQYSGAGFSFNNSGYSKPRSWEIKNLVSWTFRKAPKFFDIVTYTGTGSFQVINHSLGVAPGMIIVKRTDATGDWAVYNRGVTSATTYPLYLNTTAAAAINTAVWSTIPPTSSDFKVGSSATTNASGGTYVAYLFAHDTTTDGLIQCGSYTGNGSFSGPTINLGWEPQYLLIKNAVTDNNAWVLLDNMRGISTSGNDAILWANSGGIEDTGANFVDLTSTGFSLKTTQVTANGSGHTYIYMAIRRGPMRTPTDGTKVFSPLLWTTPSQGSITNINLGFPADASFRLRRGSSPSPWLISRLTGGGVLITNSTSAEATINVYQSWDNQNGYVDNAIIIGGQSMVIEGLRRAPGFFDVVCYTGTGVARTINHNLGVAPELIIVKRRSSDAIWSVYSNQTGSGNALVLNTTETPVSSGSWNNTSPTATVFSVGGNIASINVSGSTYVSYLFASCPGVSKVGSYTGNGSSQTINCGFTNGARFVLIKRTDSTGDWYVWDTVRGIVAANDPHLSLNTTAAEVTTDDTIDPDSTGFIVNQVAATNVNVSGGSYIYLAIA